MATNKKLHHLTFVMWMMRVHAYSCQSMSGRISSLIKGVVSLASTRLKPLITFQQMALFYLLMLGLSWMVNDEMKAYISSVGFVIIPVAVGFSLHVIAGSLKSSRLTFPINVRSAFGWWMIGIIFMTIVCSATSSIFPAPATTVGVMLSLFGLFFCLIWGKRAVTSRLVVSKRSLFSLFLIVAGVLLPYWYLRRLSAFPLMLGSDLTGHLADLAAVSNGARGIGLYDDAFILLIGIVSSLSGAKALWLFWSGSLIQYACLALGVYILSKRILRNFYTPIFASVVPLWFMADGIIVDLIFFLRRNVLMALIPFFVLYLFVGYEKPKSKPSYPFLIAGFVPVFYYFAISPTFYISFTSRLPNFVQALLQPGFLFTAPAFTFNMPVARLQDLYVAVISAAILYLSVKMSQPSERRMLLSWAMVSLVSILINYRMGFMLSVVFFAFLVLRLYSSFRSFFTIGVVSLTVIGLVYSGINLPLENWLVKDYDTVANLVFQTSSSVWSSQQKISFLSDTYGQFFVFLILVSVLYLSFAAGKKPKVISIITATTGVSLAAYFLPIPSSERFLVLITPFAVLLPLISVETLVDNHLRPSSIRESNPNAGKTTRHQLKRQNVLSKNLAFLRIPPEKFAETFSLIALILVTGLSITGPYDSAIRNYTSMYEPTGSISSFSQRDMRMADWIKQHMPSETLIISDPSTIQILSGLAEMPYTWNGRYFVEGLGTSSIITGRSDLFRGILSSLNAKSLTELISLFDASDHIRGISAPDRRILAVINNRTTAWLRGSPGYEYAGSFNSFHGLVYFERTSFSRNLYNSSSTYLAYELTVPVLTTVVGPELSVRYGDSSIRTVASIMTYFDVNNANFTLSLSGSDKYTVEGIPSNWLLTEIETLQVSTLNITQLENGNILEFEGAAPSSAVVIHWTSYAIFGNIVWKFVQWQSGWQAGPYSNPAIGGLRFDSVGGMLRLNLSAGVADGYSSAFRTDLSLPLNNETRILIGANGTKNAKLAVAIDLTDGRRLFLFNFTGPTWFSLQPHFQTIESQPKSGGDVTIFGIQIFILSTDGYSCESFIKCFFAIQR